MRYCAVLFSLLVLLSLPSPAQENPYFVTYDHHLEEPGDLEISTQSTFSIEKDNRPNYWAPLLELEYGATDWWTTSLYLEGAAQRNDATVFTGYRLENRFRPIKGEHKINPILYFEFEDIDEASRIRKEVVGHAEPASEPLSVLRQEKARELEAKLILSSDFKNWNVSENFIVEKNLSADEGYEFGYAFGVYRPLSTVVGGGDCRLCRKNFVAGLEMYGGLGSTNQFGFQNTAQYIAPDLMWRLGESSTFKVSTAFGLAPNSARMLVRAAYVFEVDRFGHKVARMLGHK